MVSDTEHSEHAGRHAWFSPDGSLRADRIENLALGGVYSEAQAAELALAVRTADDTWCYRGAHGHEVYGNDRLNAMHKSNDSAIEKNTVFINTDPSGREASERVKDEAESERDQYHVECCVVQGGSKALEPIRQAERNDGMQVLPGERKSEPARDASEPEPQRGGAKVEPEHEDSKQKSFEELQEELAHAEREPRQPKSEQSMEHGKTHEDDDGYMR